MSSFTLLHRDGDPFANIMTIEYRGVGLLGHVYTRPEDRRQGAAMQLMACLMEHFRQRGGQALCSWARATTRRPITFIGSMALLGSSQKAVIWTTTAPRRTNSIRAYFAAGSTAIEPVGWLHWPVSIPLFLGAFPGVVRGAGLGVWGRRSTEGPLLPLLQDGLERGESGLPPRALALVQQETRAVVGWAMWSDHPLWPDACLVDLYCHPAFWERGSRLASGPRDTGEPHLLSLLRRWFASQSHRPDYGGLPLQRHFKSAGRCWPGADGLGGC